MSSEMVHVYLNPGEGPPKFDTVPLSEVPAGYIKVVLQGFGECFTDPTKLKASGDFRHPEFPEPVRNVLRRIARVLDGLQTDTVEEWEDGFRRDKHAWTEIALYERIVDGVEKFAGHLQGDDETTREKRLDIFKLLLGLTNNGPLPKGAKPPSFGTVTASRVREICEWMSSDATVTQMRQRANQHRELILPHALAGPSRVELDALFGDGVGMNLAAEFNPRELISSAEVILGVDRDSEHEFLVYGRDLLEQLPKSESESSERVLRISLDQDTEDLEKLLALVEVVKGHHDYVADQ